MIHNYYFNKRNTHFTELPSDIYIETVSGCNLKCPMCFVPKKITKPTFLDFDIFVKILEEISFEKRHIILENLGEPLLHKDFIKFVQLAKRKKHRVSFTTNGTLLNKAISEQLIDFGLDEITISIDSINKEDYELIRVGADFNKVMENINYFIEYKNRKRSKAIITINCIAKYKLNDLIKIRNFWKGKAHLRFNQLHNWGSLFNDILPINIELFKHSKDRYPCPLLWNQIAISADGYIVNCGFDFENKDISRDIKTKMLTDVWYNEISIERKKHVENNINSAPCKECNYWLSYPTFYNINKLKLKKLFPRFIINMLRNSTFHYRMKKFKLIDFNE